MSNGFYTGYTGTQSTFWNTATTQTITFSAPQLEYATSQYQQLISQVDRNNQLRAANMAYWARVTQETREAHERSMAEWEAQRQRLRQEYEEAEKRALQLVGDVLTREEFALFERDKYIFVTNEDSGNEYKVRLNGTVLRWRFLKPYISICIVPDYGHAVPRADLFLAHYLLCKYDEDTLLTVGHKTYC